MDKKASMIRSSFIEDNKRVEDALRWRQVNMHLKAKGKKGTSDKILLNNVWGEALPNETTALMGPSGAGKTTLLNVLAGRVVPSGRVQISADVRYGYAKIETLPGGIQKFRQRIAFVPQEDVVNQLSTPREVIRFSAKLRLPRSTTNEEIELLVEEYLDKLGLSKCADAIIGGGLKKGISGGQKKRACIGIELVTDPGIIFLDEPTSGLDAVSAEDLMGLLNKLARAGNVIIFTIHQPSSSVFMSFDKLILLAEGKVMYQGPTADIPSYFDKAGYPLPQLENPADWVLKVAQRYSYDELRNDGFFFPEDHRMFEEGSPALRMSYYTPSVDNRTVPLWTQLYWLLEREFVTVKRNPGPVLIDLVSHIIMGLITGISFFNIGVTFNPNDISSVWALLIAVETGYSMSLFAQAASRLSTLASQRHLFLKEYFSGTFSISSYLTCNFTMELITTIFTELIFCILTYFLLGLKYGFGWFYLITILVALNASSSAFLFGSFFSNSQIANAFFMLIVQPQLNFTGMWASIYYIPLAARWLIYVLYMYYATAVTILLMFRDCIKDGSKGCIEILRQDHINPKYEGLYWFGFLGILIFTRLLGFAVFSIRAQKFS